MKIGDYACRVATYYPLQNSLTFPWFFPDILQFSIPSDSWKIIFILYFNGANCISSNLGLLLKERIGSPREQILSFTSSPHWPLHNQQYNWVRDRAQVENLDVTWNLWKKKKKKKIPTHGPIVCFRGWPETQVFIFWPHNPLGSK